MSFGLRVNRKWRLAALGCWWLLAGRLLAALTGPTLHFEDQRGTGPENPLNDFMYFIPLISPEAVVVHTNAGKTQQARILSRHWVTNGAEFRAVCEFALTGAGVQRSVFDHTDKIQRRRQELLAGHPLTHQLTAIQVAGAGRGSVEIAGRLTNGEPTVTEVRLRFNAEGQASPVSILLEDLASHNGVIGPEHELVARVKALTFRRQPGPPQMEVTLDSLKSATAGDSLWQHWLGSLKGMAVNLFLPPLTVTAEGHAAMLGFGRALAMGQSTYRFPLATRLQAGAADPP